MTSAEHCKTTNLLNLSLRQTILITQRNKDRKSKALLSTARRCCLSPPPRRPATQLTWPPLRQRTSPSHHGGSRPDLNQPPPDSSSDLGRRHPSTLGHDDELQDQSLTLVWLTTQQQQQLGTAVVGRRAGGSGIRCRHPFVQKGRQHPSPHQSACANAKKKMSDAALSAAQWVVGKALAPVADGLLGAWAATNNFGPNVEALSTELLLVKATLEQASLKELGGRAMEMLLQKLRDSAHNAEDLLDELDYFRIHDELHNTDDAAGEHGKGYIRDLAFNARHTAKAVGKQVNCCPWQRAKHRQSSQGDSSSATDANQEVSGCMPNLIGKLLPCSSSPHPHVSADEEDHGNAQQTPKLDFNRVHFSQRMKDIVEKLQPVRKDVNEILQGCGARIALDIAQHRPTTTPQSAEPKLYGRDRVMNSIIDDITEGQYCDKGLTVLPVVGPGGMGKTTLIQHIYHNQQVQNHFPVRIWICVSFNFNLDKFLGLWEVEGMGTLEPLSNLTSLTRLILRGCGEDLKRQGLLSLLTTGGQLKELRVMGSPRFFADWDPNPRRALEVAEGSEEQQTQLVSSTLRELWTEDIAGLLAAPFFRFLSPSLTKLILYGYYYDGMERFSKEQEDALQLLSTLQELEFWDFQYLQQLPAGLRNLTSLKILSNSTVGDWREPRALHSSSILHSSSLVELFPSHTNTCMHDTRALILCLFDLIGFFIFCI
ncbi:hypothetical protein ZWY2020_046356 [Hordeum vulgare]|nr:hypothetical protein ZWY2020_046356 [Hordeum vulgare]